MFEFDNAYIMLKNATTSYMAGKCYGSDELTSYVIAAHEKLSMIWASLIGVMDEKFIYDYDGFNKWVEKSANLANFSITAITGFTSRLSEDDELKLLSKYSTKEPYALKPYSELLINALREGEFGGLCIITYEKSEVFSDKSSLTLEDKEDLFKLIKSLVWTTMGEYEYTWVGESWYVLFLLLKEIVQNTGV